MKARLITCFAAALLLGACMSTPQSAALRRQAATDLHEPVMLAQLPFFPQDAYQCGPAALATVLAASGVSVTPAQLAPLVYLPGRKGSLQVEITAAARSHGRIAYTLAPALTALLSEIRAGHPVLVLQNLGLAWYPRWHFAVAKGFDLGRGTLLLNSGVIENYEVPLTTFERTWTRAGNWALVTLAPGQIPATADAAGYFHALAALEAQNPDAGIALAYARGLEAWPGDRELLMGSGNLAYRQGDKAQAAARFGAVLTLHPHYAPAWNNLAQVLFEQGALQQARMHARRAVALAGPFSATYRATLATIEAAAYGLVARRRSNSFLTTP